ncbi:MAG TPA: hypothetical protein PKD37_05615 [Oligoflexia bacterium]|nr:hypothetical protein [Oligoflexia bacterium]HMP27443.1 hypothetical protein [Oligoflexia bacterium]
MLAVVGKTREGEKWQILSCGLSIDSRQACRRWFNSSRALPQLEVSRSWFGLNGSKLLPDGLEIRTYCLEGHNLSWARYSFELVFPKGSEKSFFLTFLAKIEGGKLTKVYNTEVLAKKSEEVYGSVIKLLHNFFEGGIRLVTFVRHKSSRKLLDDEKEQGELLKNPSNLPLVQMFRQGGWDLVRLEKMDTIVPGRRFLIVFTNKKSDES